MKKQLVLLIIITSIIAFFLIKPNKKDNEKSNDNFITILLENEKGNTKVSEFPSKEDYIYSKMNCNNLNNNTEILPAFDEENWKLNINLTSLNKMKGNFNCEIYFKEKDKLAADVIIAKYSSSNTEGLIKIDQPATVQTKETTEYRYSGSNNVVKNYVNFNGETWRIIGVFDVDNGTGKIEKRIKIIRETSLGNYSWNSTPSNINGGYGSNQWGPSGSYFGADLMQELNDTYYNSKSGICYNSVSNASTTCNFEEIGLKKESRKMIDNAKWYTGASAYSETTSQQSYTKERSNAVGNVDDGQSITKTSNWIGKIAVMYPSDYGYSSSSCYNSTSLSSYSASNCVNSNWLYQSLPNIYQWTLSPRESNGYDALGVRSTGLVDYDGTCLGSATRPTLYLKPSVKITKGTGTIEEPYEFSL